MHATRASYISSALLRPVLLLYCRPIFDGGQLPGGPARPHWQRRCACLTIQPVDRSMLDEQNVTLILIHPDPDADLTVIQTVVLGLTLAWYRPCASLDMTTGTL